MFLNQYYQKKDFQVLLLLIVVFLLELSGLWTKISVHTQSFFQPLTVISAKTFHTLGSPFLYIKNIGLQAQYVHELEISHTQLLAKVSEIEVLKKENQALRKLLENSDRSQAKRIVAATVTSYTYPSLALGHDDGIRVGQPVFFQNTLLGFIDKVESDHSEVKLLVAKKNTGIVVETESGAEGLLVGTGRKAVLTYVPNTTKLLVGERLQTALNTEVPGGLFVGIISAVDVDVTSPHQKAEITQLVSFFDTSFVEVQLN